MSEMGEGRECSSVAVSTVHTASMRITDSIGKQATEAMKPIVSYVLIIISH